MVGKGGSLPTSYRMFNIESLPSSQPQIISVPMWAMKNGIPNQKGWLGDLVVNPNQGLVVDDGY